LWFNCRNIFLKEILEPLLSELGVYDVEDHWRSSTSGKYGVSVCYERGCSCNTLKLY
jgi:hypothetical protein